MRCSLAEKGKTMDKYTATEQAFKHGYEKGYEAGKPKWIPVSDRLPEPGDYVMVCDIREDWISLCEFSGDAWYDFGCKMWDIDEVTHWMPLPEPPKED